MKNHCKKGLNETILKSTFIKGYLLTLAVLLSFVFSAHGQNLLTNPSFEDAAGGGSSHGDFYPLGWHINYPLYYWAGVNNGDASDGNQKLDLDIGGWAETADNALVTVTPGNLYKMSYDIKVPRNAFPEDYNGVEAYIFFYDSSNKMIKQYYGDKVQSYGVYPWQTFTVYGTAPDGAVKARVAIDGPPSWNAGRNGYGDRRLLIDNVKLEYVQEDIDRLAIRTAPNLVEPGKSYKLVVKYGSIANSNIRVRLMNGGTAYADVSKAVNKGRGLVEISCNISSSAPNADTYSWQVDLGSKSITIPNIIIDQNQIGLGTIDADNQNIAYSGRIDFNNAKSPSIYWFGSEIRTRFSGTSVAIKCSTGGDVQIDYIIDGDETNVKEITINGNDITTTLATGLSNGIHTLKILKTNEATTGVLYFKGFVLDSGSGLFRPEPLKRKIEFYGDSVTSGGSATPAYFAYAPTLSRALGADDHIISKGGTGVGASFSGLLTLSSYWDKLDFVNAFDVSGTRTYDFTSWQPDAVFVGIGHNDQFNGGADIFTDKYRTFLGNIENKYPNAQIFCSVPMISNPEVMFQKALEPIIADHPRIHFRFERATDATVNAHPSTAGHQAFVYGDATRWSLADWMEEIMGWGIGLPGLVATTPPPPTSSSYAINTGGGATGTFAADAYVSGGNTYNVTSTIDVSGAANPAPTAVYQSERWGPSTYTFPSLTAGKSYTVRLHFAEIFFNAAGKRKFNVDINGTRELTDFDVFAAAGANNKAVVKEYTITPNSSNQIIIAFTNGALDNAKISGIEVFPATSTSTTFSGYYKLTAKHSGKVLDVDQSSTADGATVKQYTSNGTDAQKWLLEDVGGGYYSLKARCSGKALDVNGGPTATGNGVKVQQWTYGGGDNQKWKIDSVGGGYYKLTAKHSGKCLDISGGPSATGDGALANQWDYAGGDNQKWALTYISATGAREASATGKKVENTEPALNNFYVYPNPSNGIANISYTATHNEQIAIHLYDTQGKLVKTIFNGAALKGVEQNYPVDGSSLREGLYIIKLKTSSETINKKVIFNK